MAALFANILTIKTRFVSPIVSSVRFGHAFPQFVNLPKTSTIGGTGNVFETKIKRKREIVDPNRPNFEKGEPLRWTDWRMLRDVRRRYIFKEYQPNQVLLHLVKKNKLLPTSLRDEAHQLILGLPRDSSFKHLTNRCVISSKARGKLRKYRLSRHVWRMLADYNLLSGVAKACWG